MKYPDWTEFPTEELCYGHHKYGIGVYRFDSSSKNTHWWLDYELANPQEITRYEEFILNTESKS